MNVQIREYQRSDYDACCSLCGELAQHHAEIYDDPTIADDDPSQGFTEYIDNPERRATWVAELDGRIVAFAGLLVNQDAQIEPVAVSSAYRNRGIGTTLIQHAIQEARKMGIPFLSIRPVARNEKAISLFVRLGFNMIGHIDLFQDLSPASTRKWKPGITIHGQELDYWQDDPPLLVVDNRKAWWGLIGGWIPWAYPAENTVSDDVAFVSLVESLRGPFITKNLSLDWLEGKECLDIGCGGGFYCAALAFFSGGGTVGVDINVGAVAEARRRFEGVENLEFAAANVEGLPFHDSSLPREGHVGAKAVCEMMGRQPQLNSTVT